MGKDNNYLNNSGSEDSQEQGKEPFFSDDGIKSILTNKPNDAVERRWAIIKYLKHHPNSSAYTIAKALKFSYNTVHDTLKLLAFGNLVYVKMAADSQGRPIEVFFLPEVMQ